MNSYKASASQPYSTEKILKLKRILDQAQQRGQPRYFEIFVDGFKVVQRTNDLLDFDTHEEFIDDDTSVVTVMLYSDHPTSPRHTKHVFRLKQEEEKPVPLKETYNGTPLHGLNLEERINEIVNKKEMEFENRNLKEKLQERESKLKEAEDYIAKLHTGIEILKGETQSKQTVVYDRLLKLAENPPDWIKLWMISKTEEKPLAGVSEDSQKEVTIKRKNSQPSLSDQEKEFLKLLHQMQQSLDEEQLGLLMLINDKLIEESDLITDVADLVDVKLHES
jgi:hypothetical protein